MRKNVTCDVRTAQCEDETVKCEKKVREPLNVRKELSHVILKLHNVRMEPSNMKKKVTCCSRLPTSGYRTPFFGTVELLIIKIILFLNIKILKV